MELQLDFKVVESKAELCDYLSGGKCKYYIMYEFGMIMPKEVFEFDDRKVFNFYPGSIMTNRGAHPIVWSILNDEKYTIMTVYEVTASVDEGKIISQKVYEIEEEDSVKTLKEKMENGAEEQLLSVYNYIFEKENKNLGRGRDNAKKDKKGRLYD